MIKALLTIVAAVGLSAPTASAQTGDKKSSSAPRPSKTGYADVRGLHLYYETYGKGDPLVLLHGGFGATGMFAPILPALSNKRQVVALDLQGHGRTADIDRPISADAMADDVAALLDHLKIAKADVMGYSMGGAVALQVAIRHPDKVRKLVVVSTPFKRDGWFPDIRAQMEQMGPAAAEPMKQTPMYKVYSKIAPRPQDWPVLIAKIGEAIKKDYDFTKEVSALKMPVLLVFGDADSVQPTHAVAFFGLLGGGKKDGGWDGSGVPASQLAIVPGTTHYTVFASPALPAAVTPFLDAPMPKLSLGATR